MAYTRPEHCPTCKHPEFIKKGYYKTKHNGQPVPRYKCKGCRKLFSTHTVKTTYKQKKPALNAVIFKWYSSGTTQRRIAKNLGINRKTVIRKFLYLAKLAQDVHAFRLKNDLFKTNHIQFDELETFEHTKAKPISVAIAVDSKSGHIIDMQASTMKSHGKLIGFSRSKYGFREDTRDAAREDVFKSIQMVRLPDTRIVTDKNPSYITPAARFLPDCKLIQLKRIPRTIQDKRRNAEDDMWRINHTCAKLRHDLVRLGRRTWATTKRMWALQAHLELYIAYNNGYELC